MELSLKIIPASIKNKKRVCFRNSNLTQFLLCTSFFFVFYHLKKELPNLLYDTDTLEI